MFMVYDLKPETHPEHYVRWKCVPCECGHKTTSFCVFLYAATFATDLL